MKIMFWQRNGNQWGQQVNKLSQAILILDSSPVKDISDHVRQALVLLREHKRETTQVLTFSRRRISQRQYSIFLFLLNCQGTWVHRREILNGLLGKPCDGKTQRAFTGLVARGLVLKSGNYYKVQEDVPQSVFEHILPRNYKDVEICSLTL
jgi:hypothetical protein